MPRPEFSPLQLDAIKEIANIGVNRAMTALARLTGKAVGLSVPGLKILPIKDVPSCLESPESRAVAIHMTMLGDIPGSLVLLFPEKDAAALLALVMGRAGAPMDALEEREQSTLREVGNILGGAFVGAWSQVTGRTLMLSLPRFVYDMAGAVIDVVLIELSQTDEYAVVLDVDFKDETGLVGGRLVLLPGRGALKLLLEAAGRKLGEA